MQVLDAEGYEPGQQLNFMEVFKEGEKVDIAGKSKGPRLPRCCIGSVSPGACSTLCSCHAWVWRIWSYLIPESSARLLSRLYVLHWQT